MLLYLEYFFISCFINPMRVYIFSLPENLFKAESIKHFLELKGHKTSLFDSDSEFYKIISGKTNVADLIIYDFLFFNHNVFNIYDYMKDEDFLIPLIFFNDPTPHQESTEYFWNNILSIIYTEKYFNKDLYSQLISQAAAAIDSVINRSPEEKTEILSSHKQRLPETLKGTPLIAFKLLYDNLNKEVSEEELCRTISRSEKSAKKTTLSCMISRIRQSLKNESIFDYDIIKGPKGYMMILRSLN